MCKFIRNGIFTKKLVVINNSKVAHTPDREEATETEPSKCSVCGYVIAVATGHKHTHGSNWKFDEYNHWNECSCGDKTNTSAHADKNVDAKCDVCECVVNTVTPNPDNTTDDTNKPSDDVPPPQTGDNNIMVLWIVVIAVGSFAMVVTIVTRKRYVK